MNEWGSVGVAKGQDWSVIIIKGGKEIICKCITSVGIGSLLDPSCLVHWHSHDLSISIPT